MEFGEPPHSGGNAGGGIRKAVAFPCGNAPPMRAAKPRGGLFLRQIKFGGHYTKKFELISNKTPDFVRAERAVA